MSLSNINIALFEWAAKGNVEEILSALKQGGDPNVFYRPEDQKNSLHVATEGGHYEACKVLIEHGADVNSIASTPQATPLMYAVQNDDMRLTELLIHAGAKLNTSNGYGNTPLHTACRKGYKEIARFLIARGADCTLKNHKGSTALHFCGFAPSNTNEYEALVTDLIKAGAKLNETDCRGNTPLMTACMGGHLSLMKVLIGQGADKAVKNHNGESLMDTAVFYHHDHIIQARII